MVRRRGFIISFGTTAFAWPVAVRAQQAAKVWRIGYLGAASGEFPHLDEAFEQRLAELGYVKGRNLTIEYRRAHHRLEWLPELAAELVRLKVDVIVAVGNPPTWAAAKVTTTIPIVFLAEAPADTGFIVSLARPGKNLTGISVDASAGRGAKALELLKEIVPSATRIASFRFTAPGSPTRYFDEVVTAARALAIKLEVLEFRSVADIDHAIAAMAQRRPDALFVPPGPIVFARRRQIADFAAKHRLPTAYGSVLFSDVGGLVCVGADMRDLWRHLAVYVDKILKGANPAETPVEQPTKFALIINLKTAKALGITILDSILVQADEVIE